MTQHPTSPQHAAACGALVLGASWPGVGGNAGAGATKRLPACLAIDPVPNGDTALRLFVQSRAGF